MAVNWDDIKTAALPSERSGYFTEGKYKVKIGDVTIKRTQAGTDAFIVECEVLESNNAEHPIGVTRAWFQKMTDERVAIPAVKGFMLAVAGVDPKDESKVAAASAKLPAIMLALEKNPALLSEKGKTVALECRQILTKTGKPFTLHVWSAWSPPEGWRPAATPAASPEQEARAAQRSAAEAVTFDL